MALVSLADVQKAAGSIADIVVRTPLLPAASWAGGELWLKPENLQPTGAFKLRGAFHAVASLPPEQRSAGIVAHSSGNHAQAVAYSARHFGVPCVVVMPDVSVPSKIEATRALGAEVVLVPADERLPRCAWYVAERGMTLVPPFDNADIIAGQGTIGLEIVADLPDVDRVLVPVGGGGLASGVATAVTGLRPRAQVIGVEPELAGQVADGLAAGHLVNWPSERSGQTIADGVRTNPSELTFAHLRARLAGVVTVAEGEILAAVRRLAGSARLVVEPSGALPVAAYLKHPYPGRTVAVLSGGNIDPALLSQVLGAGR
jgi:threonine dehydratase